jgi:hypothetical protein
MDKPSLWVDFQNSDTLGRVRLNTVGTLHDLKKLGIELQEGLAVRLYCLELEGDGIVIYSKEEGIWVAVVNWDHLKERESGAR